jgi:hypothetical protein
MADELDNCGCPPQPEDTECPVQVGCPIKLPAECIILATSNLPACLGLPSTVNLKTLLEKMAELVCILTDAAACDFTVNAGGNQVITLPLNHVALHATSDGKGVSYQWSQVEGGLSLLSSPTTSDTLASQLGPGLYTFRITATNSCNEVRTADVTVNVALPEGPTADAGADVALTLPTNQVLNHFASGTGEGITFHWNEIGGTNAIIDDSSKAITNFKNLSYGTHVFELTVTDAYGQTDTSSFQIVVGYPALSVNAGPDKTVQKPASTVTLQGSGTGTGLTFSWQRISGNSDGIITFVTNPVTGVTNLIAIGRTTYRLTGTDQYGQTASDDVNVDVVAALACPTVNAGPDQSRGFTGGTVTLAGQVTAGNGTVTSKIWSLVSGPAAVVITTPSLLNTTVTGFTAAGTYVLKLTAQDSNGCTITDTMQVVVTDTPCCDPSPSGVTATVEIITSQPTYRVLGFSSNPVGKFALPTDACNALSTTSFPLMPDIYISPNGLDSNGEIVLSGLLYTDPGLTTPYIEAPFNGFRVMQNQISGSKTIVSWVGTVAYTSIGKETC